MPKMPSYMVLCTGNFVDECFGVIDRRRSQKFVTLLPLFTFPEPREEQTK